MDEIKLKPCPLCGGKMETRFREDQEGERGYYVACTRCNLYFGLSEEAEEMGYLQGNYYNAETVALEWNARVTAPVLPIPCVNVQGKTIKSWFRKINEELDEFKETVLLEYGLDDDANKFAPNIPEMIAEEAADTITAITSMCEAMGITEQERQDAQKQVNQKNKERGRF